MPQFTQIKIPATLMRGGTSKGVFFRLQDLPQAVQAPGTARDKMLLRIIGSPDPYGKQIDGMGGGSSSTSKVVIVSKSDKATHDVDYLFGQVAIDQPIIDWSGNCGNLTAAVGAFAINNGLVDRDHIPENGIARVRIWQKNIGKTIIANIPISDSQVQESGTFELDGVTFPAAEVQIEFIEPVEADDAIFPTGSLVDELNIPDVGTLKATLINAGIPTVFINAEDIGLQGTELQSDINGDKQVLLLLESIRAQAALKMGLIDKLEDAAQRRHTPKIAFIARPKPYTAAGGKYVAEGDIDLLVRAVSMGLLHHAMMGTAAVAVSAAAAIPGTLVNLAAGGGERSGVCFGHPSGTLNVGAETQQRDGQWFIKRVLMSRSARVLMEGWVRVPVDSF